MSGQLGEGSNDSSNEITRCVEGVGDRKTLSNPRLIEHYRKSEINILVWFRIKGIDVDYIACFQREDPPSRADVILNSDSGGKTVPISGTLHCVPSAVFEESSVPADIEQPEGCRNGSKGLVFVENVQLMQPPQVRINSVMWIESLDYLFSIWREATYFGVKGVFSLGSLLRWINERKTSAAVDVRGERANHMIQSAPQVMESVSDGGSNIGRIADLDHAIDQLTRVRVSLGSDFVRVLVPEGEEFIFDFVDVLFGPLNLGLSATDLSCRHHMGS